MLVRNQVATLTNQIVLATVQEVEELEDVFVLNVSAMGLWSLGSVDFGRLMRLEMLDLSHNKLRSVEQLVNAVSLRELYMDSNYVQDISGLFGSLAKLRTLSCRGNLIDSVAGIGNLVELHTLAISDNCFELEHVLGELKDATTLRVLDIGEYIDPHKHLPWLEVLDGVTLQPIPPAATEQPCLSPYDQLLVSKHPLQERVEFLEAENARLREDVVRLESDAEIEALRMEVKMLRILAEENTRLHSKIQQLEKPQKPGNAILAKQISKISTASNSRPQTAASVNTGAAINASSRPSTAMILVHVEMTNDSDHLDRLLEESERRLVDAQISLNDAEKHFGASRAHTAASLI